MDHEDFSLLQEYARSRSDAVFARMVERHVNLVYSTALRQVRDSSLAEEVSQSVFILLARKANNLCPPQILTGWLYRTTCHVASEMLRARRRRLQREREAVNTLYNIDSSETWTQIEPMLDQAMASLNEKERNAILLHFFENRPLRAVGAALGINDDTAQKRVARALDKMRQWFSRRGATFSGPALAAILSGSAVQLAPEGLAAAISASASAAAAAAGTFSLKFLFIKSMSILNMKTAVSTVAALATGAVVFQQQLIHGLRREKDQLEGRLSQFDLQSGSNESGGATDKDWNRLRQDAAEVHRLRGEVAELRGAKAEAARLQAEIEKLNAQLRMHALSPTANAGKIAEEKQLQEAGLLKMNHVKNWVLAFVLFADQHDGQLPPSFTDAASFYPKENDESLLGLTGAMYQDMFEITYKGKLADLLQPAATIIIREKRAWAKPDGGWARTYGFADGHSEVHSGNGPDFGEWERQRLAKAVE